MAGQAGVSPHARIEEYRKEQFLIRTDPGKLDVGSILAFLSQSFWNSEGGREEA